MRAIPKRRDVGLAPEAPGRCAPERQEQQHEFDPAARQRAGRQVSPARTVPDFEPGRHGERERQGRRRRARPASRPTKASASAAGARPQPELHRAQDLVRRRRRARVPALFADGRSVEVVRRGKVRRAKLYYLRGRAASRPASSSAATRRRPKRPRAARSKPMAPSRDLRRPDLPAFLFTRPD